MPKKSTKKIYNASFAADISCYCDFTVEATSERQANAKIRAALKAGSFDNVPLQPYWDDSSNRRVFLCGEGDNRDRMEDLEGFEPVTRQRKS